MSLCNKAGAIKRIEAAEPDSPVAVFKKSDRYDVLFASTYMTTKRIEKNEPDLVGVFNKNMDRFFIEKKFSLVS